MLSTTYSAATEESRETSSGGPSSNRYEMPWGRGSAVLQLPGYGVAAGTSDAPETHFERVELLQALMLLLEDLPTDVLYRVITNIHELRQYRGRTFDLDLEPAADDGFSPIYPVEEAEETHIFSLGELPTSIPNVMLPEDD